VVSERGRGAHSRPGEPRTSSSLPRAGRRPSVHTEPRTSTTAAAAPLVPSPALLPRGDASPAASPSRSTLPRAGWVLKSNRTVVSSADGKLTATSSVGPGRAFALVDAVPPAGTRRKGRKLSGALVQIEATYRLGG
jgi:hypothetical protein